MYSIAYQSQTEVLITADVSVACSIEVSKLNSSGTFSVVVSSFTLNAGQTYTYTYSSDGIYRYKITQGSTSYFYDLNYYIIRYYLTQYIEDTLLDFSNVEDKDIYLFDSLALNTIFYCDNNMFNIHAAIPTITTQIQADMDNIYDAITRSNEIITTLIQRGYVSELS